jgi:hypothetical protein
VGVLTDSVNPPDYWYKTKKRATFGITLIELFNDVNIIVDNILRSMRIL